MRLPGRLGMLAGLVAALAACGDPSGTTGEQMELARAKQLWNARDVDDYRMTVRRTGAWVGGSAVVEVRNGVPVSVDPVEQGGTPEFFAAYDTVEELFAILDDAVEEDADRITATFHTRFGVPLDVYIDFREDWADEEHGFRVEGFQRL